MSRIARVTPESHRFHLGLRPLIRRVVVQRIEVRCLATKPIYSSTTNSTGTDEIKLGKEINRLSKILAKLGVASRREAEEIIADGRVTVNGEIITIPQTIVHLKTDKIKVDGKLMKQKQQTKLYFVLNKPAQYLCSSKITDTSKRRPKLVLDLFEPFLQRWKIKNPKGAIPPRLFTVGRLDKDTTGLLFVTNDGEWAQNVAHPSFDLTKEYVVHTNPQATMKHVRIIGDGCKVDREYVTPVGVAKDADFLRIVVSEGRNREVRNLVENAGLEITSLKRVRIGGFRMPSDLKISQYRALRPNEIRRVTNLGAQTDG